MLTRIFAPLSVWRTRLAWSKWFLLFLFCISNVYAQQVPQPGTISTFAGKTPSVVPGTLATDFAVVPRSVIQDEQGNIYLTSMYRHHVYKINTQQQISVFAGNGLAGFSGDGAAATDAMLDSPAGLALDKEGNLYVSETVGHRVRKVDTQGVITTVAGNGVSGFAGDGGSALIAQINYPSDIDVDTLGNLYIVDTFNHRVRKVTTDGVITTIAGNGTSGFDGDGGSAANAMLRSPYGLDVDATGNVYIADTSNHRIRKVDTNGVITTVAGSASLGFGGDGFAATSAKLLTPFDVTVDTTGQLYIADTHNNRIRRVDRNGVINTVGGSGTEGFSGDGGSVLSAQLNSPTSVALSSASGMLISDASNMRLRSVNSENIITTIAGGSLLIGNGDGGQADNAQFEVPIGSTVDSAGNMYIADMVTHTVRKIDVSGVTSTVAGTGVAGLSGDGGKAVAAQLNIPFDVAVDSLGNLYIADVFNNRVRKVDVSGNITTVAGTSYGFSGDGALATQAQLRGPSGLEFDAEGNLYISDTSNHRIRKVDTRGVITTVAGASTGGVSSGGFSGDDGAATAALLNFPVGIAFDQSGALHIGESGNHRVRKVDGEGVITTIAGSSSTGGFAGDAGLATAARLNNPSSLVFDDEGNLYITDQLNHRIRKVNTKGVISTVVGTGSKGYSGDGAAAVNAQLYSPSSIVKGASGSFYITDTGTYRVRKFIPKADQIISFTTPSAKTFGDSVFNLTVTGGASSSDLAFTTSTPLVCGLSNASVTIKSAGTCEVKVSQAGDDHYNEAAEVTKSFSIAKASQVITFALPKSKSVGDASLTLTARGGVSGNAVTFKTKTPTVCAVDDKTKVLTLESAGTCTVVADQEGTDNYEAAAQVSSTMKVEVDTETVAGTTVAITKGSLSGLAANNLDALENKPSGVTFDLGGYSYRITGLSTVTAETVRVTLTLSSVPAEGAKLYKVSASGFVEITNATFDGLTVSYDVTDGGPLDEDGIHNGVIVDPVAIGVPVTSTASTSTTSNGSSSSGGGGSMKPFELLLGLLLLGLLSWRQRAKMQ